MLFPSSLEVVASRDNNFNRCHYPIQCTWLSITHSRLALYPATTYGSCAPPRPNGQQRRILSAIILGAPWFVSSSPRSHPRSSQSQSDTYPTPTRSLPFSTSSHFCSLSSCSFVLVRTSALSHRDSSIATSKGASPRFWSCALLATSFFAFPRSHSYHFFRVHVLSTLRILMPYDLI